MISQHNLPQFFEHEQDSKIPANYGIEQSHDGGWYPYKLGLVPLYLKDDNGLDLWCATREEALTAILSEKVEG